MVGATEDDLRARGVDYEVGRAAYHDNARGQIIGEPDGAMKLLFAPRHASSCWAFTSSATAPPSSSTSARWSWSTGGTIDVFIDSVFNFPTLAEIYKYAAYDGLGRLARRTA